MRPLPTAARILAAVVALVACAWFALGIREGHDASQATRALANAGRLTPAQASHVSHLLDGAATLNPDRTIDVLRASLRNHAGDQVGARTILFGVLADEPRNIDAWQLMALVSGRNEPALSQLARERVRELAPAVRLP